MAIVIIIAIIIIRFISFKIKWFNFFRFVFCCKVQLFSWYMQRNIPIMNEGKLYSIKGFPATDAANVTAGAQTGATKNAQQIMTDSLRDCG
jgi:hypothetical protein